MGISNERISVREEKIQMKILIMYFGCDAPTNETLILDEKIFALSAAIAASSVPTFIVRI